MNTLLTNLKDIGIITLLIACILFLLNLIETMIHDKVKEIRNRKKEQKALDELTDKMCEKLIDRFMEEENKKD